MFLLEKQKAKLTIVQGQETIDLSQVKSPEKKKSKGINRSCKENDKKKKLMLDNIIDEKRVLKKRG